MSSRVELGVKLHCSSKQAKLCSREGLHLNDNKTIIFFFSGGTQVVLVQSLDMVFSFRVSNPSSYCRFWSMAGSDKRV